MIDLLKEDLEQVSHVKQLENTLEETKNKIQNILTAIEQGIIVKSTLERLHELEKENMKSNPTCRLRNRDTAIFRQRIRLCSIYIH